MSSRRGFLRQLGMAGAAAAAAPVVLRLGPGEEDQVEVPAAASPTQSDDAIVEMVEVDGIIMVQYPLAVRTAMLETREHFAALEQWGMYQRPDHDSHVFTLRGTPEHVNAIKEALSEENLRKQPGYEESVSAIRKAIEESNKRGHGAESTPTT